MAKTLNQAEEAKKTLVLEVVRFGEKLILPDGVGYEDAIEVLKAKQVEEEQVVGLNCEFETFVWDGAFALGNALDTKFGWYRGMTTPGSFFTPAMPPALRTIKTGPDTNVQVPWGRFLIPGIADTDGFIQTGVWQDRNGMYCFRLSAQIRRKHSNLFHTLCEEIRQQIRIRSLYKGKAISIQFLDSNGEKVESPEPAFPRIASVDRRTLVFNREIEAQIEANLLTPITKTDKVRKARIPLKRGIALAGAYGTGKTLVATLTADLAVKNGWTFVFCKSAAEFPECVEFARNYQPAVVFCEDIDRTTDGDRDEEMDRILNTIDGVDSKASEVILVLTTNEVENIHKGMLRPGRLDAVIVMKRPDAESVSRLIHLYAEGRIPESENLHKVGVLLEGSTPAVIREVVERAKLTALSLSDSDEIVLNEEALLISAQTMKTHLDLLNEKPVLEPSAMQVLGNVLGKHIVAAAEIALQAAPETLIRHLVDGSVPEDALTTAGK